MWPAIIIVFVLGYLLITLEHKIEINKTAIALVTGVICWTIYILGSTERQVVAEEVTTHLGEIAGIVFFLVGAMTIVELIDAHDGFDVITNTITTTSKKKLLVIVSVITFFLSAALDNLTTTIVMVSLLRKLIDDKEDRMLFVGMVLISANAGGAWSPIGDVTTTMLWIGGQITTANIIVKLILPSLVCLAVPLIIVWLKVQGQAKRAEAQESSGTATARDQRMIFFSGLVILLMVPVFKTVTHLPPFMGMLIGLGIFWVISEILHKDKDEAERKQYTVHYALRKIDMPSVLFFLGILIAISALETAGILKEVAIFMDRKIGNLNLIVIVMGLLSSVVDNVPLVAATMGMYDLQTFPTDHYFWEFLAYCAGTGGSALIIGSAAGVVAMGIEKIDFFWYLRRISWLALLGYFAGVITYIGQTNLL